MDIQLFAVDVLVVLSAGLVAGAICKRIGVSLLVGYLVIGAVVGNGVLGLVTQANHELEYLARASALFLLFSVGIEFSLEELLRLSRYLLIGGLTQMMLVAGTLVGIAVWFDMTLNAAILLGLAVALSSTVLVFKALAEWGQTGSPHGRRAIGILLFQDIALVPLMLLVPMLTNSGASPDAASYLVLGAESLIFAVAVVLLRLVTLHCLVPLLIRLRSVELIVLFALSFLGGVCFGAVALGLPPAIGALAAGMMLSGNRISQQIDTIVLPFRESFAAVFFVTLGTLLEPESFLKEPVMLTVGLIGILVLKALSAGVALKLVGLPWKAAMGMGLGLAQLGEFSFLVLAEGLTQGVVTAENYNRMLFIAMGTLILTPQLMKWGLKWTDQVTDGVDGEQQRGLPLPDGGRHALVVGIGLIGRQVASRLQKMGVHVGLVDLSPVNFHGLAQQGFEAIAGDACDPEVLARANADRCDLVVVCVPVDEVAKQVVSAVREFNPQAAIVVRCRYEINTTRLELAGASAVISEETEASNVLMQRCDSLIERGASPDANSHSGKDPGTE